MPLNPTATSHRIEMCMLAILVSLGFNEALLGLGLPHSFGLQLRLHKLCLLRVRQQS